MCGRFAFSFTWRQLHALLDLHRVRAEGDVAGDIDAAELRPSFNCAPTQLAPVVRLGPDAELEGALLRWGLIPSWADDAKIGSRMFNARSETAASLPAFRSAFRSRRCIVPVSSFYEWQAVAGAKTKQPWSIARADGGILLLAGLWESWRHEGRNVPSFTILTTSANEVMRPLHDRMPCVVEAAHARAWLDPRATSDAAQAMLAPAGDGVLRAHRVGLRVGSVRNNDPELPSPVDAA